jgi:hypothetical protein
MEACFKADALPAEEQLGQVLTCKRVAGHTSTSNNVYRRFANVYRLCTADLPGVAPEQQHQQHTMCWGNTT